MLGKLWTKIKAGLSKTRALFSGVADLFRLKGRVDRWLVATLPAPRGANAALLRERLQRAGVRAEAIGEFDAAGEAYSAARGIAAEADRIIVFGSFLTVAAALAQARDGRGV